MISWIYYEIFFEPNQSSFISSFGKPKAGLNIHVVIWSQEHSTLHHQSVYICGMMLLLCITSKQVLGVFYNHAMGMWSYNKSNVLASNYCLCSLSGIRGISHVNPLSSGGGAMALLFFWNTSEQKAECQFNWCVCGSGCTLLTRYKLVPGCDSRTRGLTHWYVHTSMIRYSGATSEERWMLPLYIVVSALASCLVIMDSNDANNAVCINTKSWDTGQGHYGKLI